MNSIEKLISLFSEFPTIGSRTARRFVFFLINLPKERVDELIVALQEIKQKISLCSFCFQPFENVSGNKLCEICSHHGRAKELLCVVEKETDLISIENTKKYNGLYFILGGNVQTLRKNLDHLRINQLKERIQNSEKFGVKTSFTEIIIATNPTPEGQATSVLVEKVLKELNGNFKVSHLAKGLPVGGELEYADEETLDASFKGRN